MAHKVKTKKQVTRWSVVVTSLTELEARQAANVLIGLLGSSANVSVILDDNNTEAEEHKTQVALRPSTLLDVERY